MKDDTNKIENDNQLEAAFYQLMVMETARTALQEQLQETNPDLLIAAVPAYDQRITGLQREIATYLFHNSSAVSIIANFATARNAPPRIGVNNTIEVLTD